MDGLSEENNEIFLELNPEAMVRALKSATAAKSVKIKLTKKHVPCITLEVELVSVGQNLDGVERTISWSGRYGRLAEWTIRRTDRENPVVG